MAFRAAFGRTFCPQGLIAAHNGTEKVVWLPRPGSGERAGARVLFAKEAVMADRVLFRPQPDISKRNRIEIRAE